MLVDGSNFRMDRILRVIVWAGESTSIHDTDDPNKKCVIEYCPMADADLNARIEVTEKEVPIINSKRNGPGFSAKIRIYNPPQTLNKMISDHVDWSFKNTALDPYYNKRLYVTIDAGYWNNENAASGGDGREYNRLFGVWLNTSSYYRKGVDNILEMFCHSIRITPQENNSMIQAASVARNRTGNYLRMSYESHTRSSDNGRSYQGWDNMIRHVITDNAEFKAPKTPWGVLNTVYARNASLAPVEVTANDRSAINKFYYINYVYEPRNLEDIESDKRIDEDLMKYAQDYSTQGISLTGKTLAEKIQQMADRLGVRWHEDLTYTDGMTRYYFWEPAASAGNKGKKKDTLPINNDDPDIIIYNFQNLLQVPSIDGAGQFTIKMMFNPQAKPNKNLMLKWVDGLTHNGMISPGAKGVMSTAQIGQYYPSLQAGAYNAQVAALLGTNGDVFNVSFKIAYITHTLSTHSDSWSTEVKTTAVALKPRSR